MTQETLITLPWDLERDPPPFEGNDIKHPESFTRHILEKFTKRGDTILDPFTGLGTSMFVAEEMERIPFGVEAEQEKYEWVAGQIENWTHLINDDAANILKYDLPKMDLIVTCPPYMTRNQTWNPLYEGDPSKAGYDKYLKRMGFIFSKLPTIMKKNTHLIVLADNFHHGKTFTPLAHDLATILKKNFVQINETIVLWDNPKPDYPYTQYMTFKKI